MPARLHGLLPAQGIRLSDRGRYRARRSIKSSSFLSWWIPTADCKSLKLYWRQTAAGCPGIGKGELVRIETVRTLAQEMRAAYPSMYP